jgi:hypothetical protein
LDDARRTERSFTVSDQEEFHVEGKVAAGDSAFMVRV